ncbi:tautomerase family protein [Microlunatus capsulatus]|uniref:Tautomerase enzyme n=1 Tax=Microlunatus capsulatus TaxID=99117 RepID=A0ABS4Z7J5_9ACTN|nr:tautomerase family protein [Microlunatus capsulatus]MBP2416939.1 hypothetical protein [Microlunatus capsulatus]
MPHVRIDMHRELAPRMSQISDAVHAGLVSGLDMTPDDLFQVFRLHDEGELVYSRTFPDADRTDIVFIEILASPGYTDEQKQRGMTAVADRVAEVGIKKDNLLLVLVETAPGVAWHAPAAEG